MAVEFNFYLSDEDFSRLYEIKAAQGKQHLSGNEFAAQLLEQKIRELHPEQAAHDEE